MLTHRLFIVIAPNDDRLEEFPNWLIIYLTYSVNLSGLIIVSQGDGYITGFTVETRSENINQMVGDFGTFDVVDAIRIVVKNAVIAGENLLYSRIVEVESLYAAENNPSTISSSSKALVAVSSPLSIYYLQ
ncbi:MAG: hypothetical protein M1834_007320 [Cirrosporium novae-zelandiae]|nr:MAG: hypothetical protein M1834_007320 [Cirrosporium novae-zelandiae]